MKKRLFCSGWFTAAIVVGCSTVGTTPEATLDTQAAAPAAPGATYCNPIVVPNYPLGKRARDVTVGDPVPASDLLWLVDKAQQYRELADVTVLWHQGAWYMYPSVDMAWVTKNGGATWEHHPLNVRDIGYA